MVSVDTTYRILDVEDDIYLKAMKLASITTDVQHNSVMKTDSQSQWMEQTDS